MVIKEFWIDNFTSISEEQKFKFYQKDEQLNNLIYVYGPNGSGKSNIFRAMKTFKEFVKKSTNADWVCPYTPFAFNNYFADKPTKFTIVFSYGDDTREELIYRYSFEFNKVNILTESLEYMKDVKYAKWTALIERSKSKNDVLSTISPTSIRNFSTESRIVKDLKKINEMTQSNALLITQLYQFNNYYGNMLRNVVDRITLIDGDNATDYSELRRRLSEFPSLKEKYVDILAKLDFKINDLQITKDNILFLSHSVRDENLTSINNHLLDYLNESKGTRIILNLLPYLLDNIESTSNILYIDEFGGSIHTKLSSRIIDILTANNKNSTVIVNTHDINLLDNNKISRDNVVILWNTLTNNTKIMHLFDMKSVRQDEDFRKKMLNGNYGGIPLIWNDEQTS